MDYGKIAYYKTEELERNLSRSGGLSGFTVTAADVQTGGALTGERVLAQLSGSGLITVTVMSSGGRVAVRADGADIGEGENTFTVAAPAGDCAVSVYAEGATVSSVRVTAAGVGVSLAAAGAKLAADGDGSVLAAMREDGGLVRLYGFLSGQGIEKAVLGAAADFDVACGGGIYAAAAREGGGVLLAKFNPDFSLAACRLIGTGAKCVGLAAYGGGAALALYDGGAVYVWIFGGGLELKDKIKAHVSPSVTSAGFVKGSGALTLALTDGGKCLIRTTDAQSPLTLTAAVALSVGA